MPAVERLAERGNRRAQRALRELGEEFRGRRVAMGLSQRQVASSAGVSRVTYLRIELGRLQTVGITTASRISSVLGLDLAIRAYVAPGAIKGEAHATKLGRVLEQVGAPLVYRTEVPLPATPDRPYEQRAWDAMVSGLGRRTGFEMEMRIRDAQALERRIELKWRDDAVDSVVLLAADTRNNRDILRCHPSLFPKLARLTFRELRRLLRAGQHPPSAVVLV